jgi:hypothetical protein
LGRIKTKNNIGKAGEGEGEGEGPNIPGANGSMRGILDLFIILLLIIAPVSSLWLGKNIFSEGRKIRGMLDERKEVHGTHQGWSLRADSLSMLAVRRRGGRRTRFDPTVRSGGHHARPLEDDLEAEVEESGEAGRGPSQGGPTAAVGAHGRQIRPRMRHAADSPTLAAVLPTESGRIEKSGMRMNSSRVRIRIPDGNFTFKKAKMSRGKST